MPALSQAREHAKSTNCLGNMKQLGMGLGLYTHQFDYYPCANVNVPYSGVLYKGGMPSWKLQIMTMLTSLSADAVERERQISSGVCLCPSYTMAEKATGAVGSKGGYGYPYTGQSAPGKITSTLGYRGATDNYTNAIRKTTEVKRPSLTGAVGETDDYPTGELNGNRSTLVYVYTTSSSTAFVRGRHKNYTYMNIAWCDGHASSMRNIDLTTGKPVPGFEGNKEYDQLYYWNIISK